jgi:hypothetical protein
LNLRCEQNFNFLSHQIERDSLPNQLLPQIERDSLPNMLPSQTLQESNMPKMALLPRQESNLFDLNISEIEVQNMANMPNMPDMEVQNFISEIETSNSDRNVEVRRTEEPNSPQLDQPLDIVIQSDSQPQGPCSPEDNSMVSSLETYSKLPPRMNRGKPPKRYVPEDGTSKEIRYPIANYTTVEKLPKPLKDFSNQISSVIVPNSVEEALKDPKWVEAMEVEMNALKILVRGN